MRLLLDKLKLHVRLKVQMLLISILFLVLVSVVTWTVVSRSQDELIQFEAIKLAEIVADQASGARSAYASLAVSKLYKDGFGAAENSEKRKGHVPLPAQFLRELSQRSQRVTDAAFSFKPVSRWNLAPDQGLSDDFLRWAWVELENQQTGKTGAVTDWKPVWRIDEQDGEHMLRYLRADPASSQSCVDCHNALEKRANVVDRRITAGVAPGKQWQLNELMGAIEVKISLDQAVMLARSQTQQGLFIVVGVTVIGLIGVVLLVFMDSARNRAMTTELTYQARHDSLTGLPNRLQFELQVSSFLDRRQAFTMMVLDLDNFKQINDTLGHEAGDGVLTDSSVRIQSAMPDNGFVARLGGDEFAFLLPGNDQDMIDRVVDDISRVITKSFTVESYNIALGVSIGIALYPVHGSQLSELLRCADVAMYLAKNAGIDSLVYDSLKDQNHVSKLLLNNALQDAIASDEIFLHYQPQYCLRTGRMKGVEALARWNSSEHGFIPPDVFISLAEKLGLIDELTNRVLTIALRDCRCWRQLGFDLSVSVNLSALSLVDRRIVDVVRSKLANLDVAPEALTIEVTEGAVMADPERAIKVLEELCSLGVKISVDDYGTGYCSLSYLTSLPIHELKLDRSFVQRIERQEKDAMVVKATTDLTRSLNLTMVAEGIEDATTLDYLCSIGCDLGQGYFLCRPLSITDFNRRLPFIYKFKPRVGCMLPDINNSPLQKAA